MDIHLFATDQSAISLARRLSPNDRITALIIPENRLETDKVKQLIEKTPWPHFVHERRNGLPRRLPPAHAGLSWLYSQMISPTDLSRYTSGILNMHGGKIPEYRGASVLTWAIINGDDELGITWHEMSEDVDSGPIWHESAIPIPRDATALDMREAMIEAGMATFGQAWQRFRQRRPEPRYPDLSKGHVWPMRRPRDGALRPGLSEFELRNFVRALARPGLTAFFSVGGNDVPIKDVVRTPSPGVIPYRCSEGTEVYLVPAEK
jgi:methionyl-tRNA formyltransferase